LIARTAPVALAWRVTPTARTKMPGMSNTFEPSMSRPIRPSTYGGVQTVAPSAPATALVVSLSRRDPVALTPISREGIAT
jgi:hypothetical protein